MKIYTSTLEKYIEGDISGPNPRMICDQRNLIQYHLMSFPPARSLTGANPFYEVCRISAIIYSVGVTFPLPGAGAPFASLARTLKTELQVLGPCCDWPSLDANILVWLLTLGGIAATGLSERKWFVVALARQARRALLCQWQELKQALKATLWLDSACDRAGEQLWTEVMALMSATTERQPVPMLTANSHVKALYQRDFCICQQCRQRKIKCDKGNPCRNCVMGGFNCSYVKDAGNMTLQRLPGVSRREQPCHKCRQRKIKCDKQTPCRNCVKDRSVCFYAPVRASSTAQHMVRKQPPCQQCRQRQIKCSKQSPCLSCLKSGCVCTYEQFPHDVPEQV